jgi:hypothetical protein
LKNSNKEENMSKEPAAKLTLCGYGWTDVCSALIRAIANADIARAQRWAAELVCSPNGLGRLEATLLHAYALHVGPKCNGDYPRVFKTMQTVVRNIWARSGGDVRTVRNTPAVRTSVAEAVALLVYSSKNSLPSLPTSADVMKEAEPTRVRLKTTGGAGDQTVTLRLYDPKEDAPDLKTIGNEFEAALRSNNVPVMLFWIVWTFTLDSAHDCPRAKERGSATLTAKAKSSLVWFLLFLLREVSYEMKGSGTSAGTICDFMDNIILQMNELWTKLGAKGRRDCVAAAAVGVSDAITRRGSLVLSSSSSIIHVTSATPTVRASIAEIDVIYTAIAEEARKYTIEAPSLALSSGMRRSTAAAPAIPTLSSLEKLALVHSLTYSTS